MGRADHLELGTWNALCDRCQKKYKANQLRKEWTGWMVCESCWEPRHPQEFLRGQPEDENVDWSRPDTRENIDTYDDTDATLTVGTSQILNNWNTDLTADRTITLDTTGAENLDRFIIYRTGEGAFDLIIGSVQTTGIPSVTTVEYNGIQWNLVDYTPLGL